MTPTTTRSSMVTFLKKISPFHSTEGNGEAPDPADLDLEEVHVRPRKSDISVSRMALAWVPWVTKDDGTMIPAQ